MPGGRCAQRSWSCDTFAVHAEHTRYGATLLAKNSDRPAGESQPLRWLAPRRGGGRLRLAYVELDDVTETFAHLGSSPYWCWGHESGVNVHGVAIGNEAIFTRDLAENVARARAGTYVQPGILGMELVRIALERSDSAPAAVEVMTRLLEQYGQWGAGTRGGDPVSAAYDNSYLVADPDEIWVLETSGRRWVAKRVRSPWWAVSNEPTIRDDWTRCADDLRRHACDNGWAAEDDRAPDFAAVFTDPMTPLQVSHLRLQRARQLLSDTHASKGMGFHEARRVLSDHYEGTFLDGPKFNPARPDFHTLCMHDHPAGFTWGNTAASTIAVLPSDGPPLVWWAATTPCTSIYVPVAALGYPLPPALEVAGTAQGTGPDPERAAGDSYHAGSYWWAFQALLDTVVGDGACYDERQPLVRARFDELQQTWLDDVAAMPATASAAEWAELTDRCANAALTEAMRLVGELPSLGTVARRRIG